MPNNLKIQLQEIEHLEKLSSFIDDLEAQEIGLFGGRKFKQKENVESSLEGELTLNDIVKRFDELKGEIATKGQVTLEIRRKIHQRDDEANDKLEKTNIFTKIMTALRSTIFGSSPKVTGVGLYSREWTREQVLQELAKSFDENSLEKKLYLAEEIFDDSGYFFKKEINPQEVGALKKGIIDFVERANEESLINAAKNFLRTKIPRKKNAHYEDYFLRELIYNYRKSEDEFISHKLAPLLLAAYALANEKSKDLQFRQHRLQNFTVLRSENILDGFWRLKDDPELISAAENKYMQYQPH